MQPSDFGYGSAEGRAKAKLAFINHLAIYLLVIGGMALVNAFTNPQRLWFVWPMFGWGIGILLHGLNVFAFGPESRIYERLLDHERRHDI